MKQLAIAILVMSLLIVGVTVGVSAHANNPKTVVRNSIGDIVEELAERDEIAPIISVLTQGSVTIEASTEISDEEEIKMGGKIYFSDKDIYLENVHVKADGIKLDADFYLGEEYMYVTNDKILGGTYGIVYDEIVNNLKKSIFAYDSGSEYAIPDEETYDQLIKMLEVYTDGKLDDIPKDIEKIYERYTKILIKAVEKHAEYESDKDEVKIGADYMRARTVTVTIDEKAVVNIIKDVYEELKDDDDLRKVIAEYADYFEGLMIDFGSLPEEGTEDFDIEEYYDEALDTLGDSLDELEDNIPEFKVGVKLVTPTTSSTLLKFNIYARVEGEKFDIITVDFGKKGIKDSDCLRIEFQGAEIKYEITENNSKEYASSLKVSYGDGWMTIFKLSVNKKEDYYRITTPAELGDITIRGTFEQKGDKTTIGLDKIKVGEETIDGFEIKITLEEKDSAPKIISKKKIKDVIKITEKDIEKIVENVEEFIAEIGFEGEAMPDIWEDAFGGFGENSWEDDYWEEDDYWNDDDWSVSQGGFGF